jgi:hypothetical protein
MLFPSSEMLKHNRLLLPPRALQAMMKLRFALLAIDPDPVPFVSNF